MRIVILLYYPYAGFGDHKQLATQWAEKPMKTPKLNVEEAQPRNIQRADIPPADGYALVVDGRFKTQFAEKAAATKSATDLLAKYPMLQVEIYDASSKSRSSVK